MKPRLAVTLGDPGGVGAEIIVKALPQLRRFAEPVIFGHRHLLETAAKLCKVPLPRNVHSQEPEFPISRTARGADAGKASLAYLRAAVDAVQAGTCQALVTGPLCKAHIHAAGCAHPGHTELLAAWAGMKQETFLMMAAPKLRVTLVTLHVALSEVAALLTPARILRAITLTDQALRQRFFIKKPRLALAGFNPHAGEGGLFGSEEKQLRLAVRRAQAAGIQLAGPLPGDSIFTQALSGAFDAVISPYHDQGLIPIKLLYFDEAVNFTLGLPFIRTSVDHGVAFDIAWKNKARPHSLIAAARLATNMLAKQGS